MRIISEAELVVAVAEEGGLRRAADRLGLAQSNVSRRLKALEARIGAPLFRRGGAGARPTEAGQRYLRHARLAMREAARAERAAAAAEDGLSGPLSIAAPLAIGRRFVTPVAARFAARHPQIALNLRYDDALADPTAHDLLIRVGPFGDDQLLGRVLMRPELLLVAAPSWAARTPPAWDPAEAAGAGVIVIQDHKPRLSAVFRHPDGRESRVRAKPVHAASDIEAVLELCLAGLGAAALPDWLAAPHLASGALVRLFEDWRGPPIEVRALTATPRPTPGRVRAFLDDLVDALKPR